MAKKQQIPVQQTAIGDGNVQVVGDKNVVTVNQTFIQKFFNIFKGDAETTYQRNRRIMLGHVENFWVKGILEKSLHGTALLELGIKEDPDALNYPWAIKREATKETLPAGMSMLEIFQEIGMGRSLLILGAPGSGKTTTLLKLTSELIERAREDVTEPVPIVFNLSSWTEKLTLADWLARELNIIYYIPKKAAPTWVKENKMLLLLDGLDEVRQESRDKCVDAINRFRKENGLTSMAVCSRIQGYAELKTRLAFDGAIEIQPLTLEHVKDYFKHFKKGMVGTRRVLEKNTILREMAETPLFLSVMMLAYNDAKSIDILVSNNLDLQRKHLFDKYIKRMFERYQHSNITRFNEKDAIHWLSVIGQVMIRESLSYFSPNLLHKMAIISTKPFNRSVVLTLTIQGLIVVLSCMLVIVMGYWYLLGQISLLAIIIVSGILSLVFFSSPYLIDPIITRLLLSRNHLLPLKLVPFLDYCVDLIFLRRVGGGYIFVHRLLMEHFAAMYQEDPK